MSRRIKTRCLTFYCGAALLAGCTTPKSEEVRKEVEPVATIEQDGQSIPIFFPEHLLMPNAKLGEHGRIPATSLLGAEMTVNAELPVVRQYYEDQLARQGWTTDRMETDTQSFRTMASRAGETAEIRAVRGTSGPVHIFLLYTPKEP